MSIRLWLPGERPVSWNQFYSGKHWRARADEASRVHKLVYYSMLEKLGCEIEPFPVPVHITVTAHFKGRLLDPDNICAKPLIDGLVEAGLLVDDSPQYVDGVTTHSRKAGNGRAPGVEIIVEEANGHVG